MFNAQTQMEIIKVAASERIAPAALLAVAEVESGGRALFSIKDRQEPAIRFEGHYFDRRLTGKTRERAREEGLASPQAGAVKNPSTQSARWQLLERAMKVNRSAALESTSWGLGQVMGSHWKWLGYASVDALVNEARASTSGQITLMLRFIQKAGLISVLNTCDWASFAKAYNGPAYARFQYDKRMATAHVKWMKQLVAGVS